MLVSFLAPFRILFLFSFIYTQIEMKFCHKNLLLRIVSHNLWTQNQKSVNQKI